MTGPTGDRLARVAVIGAGRIGTLHGAHAAAHPRSTLVAVADADPDAASRLAERHGARTMAVDELCSAPDVDAVVVASPTHTHVGLVDAATKSGKAVFCEKPLDLDLRAARACAERVATRGVSVLMGFNRRFDPAFAALRHAIGAGEIGRPELVSITSKDPALPPASYLASSGGIYCDMMIHDFDMARFLVGDQAGSLRIAAVVAGTLIASQPPASETAGETDTAAVTLQSDDGTIVVITNSRRATYGYDQRIEVHGSGGLLQAGNPARHPLIFTDGAGVRSGAPPTGFLDRYADAYRAEWDHFVRVVLDGEPPAVTVDDAVAALVLAVDAGTLAKPTQRGHLGLPSSR